MVGGWTAWTAQSLAMYSYIHTCKSLDPKLLDARARAELPHLLSSSSAWTLAEDPPLKGAEVLVCYQLCKHRRIARLELHISYHGLPAYAKVRKYVCNNILLALSSILLMWAGKLSKQSQGLMKEQGCGDLFHRPQSLNPPKPPGRYPSCKQPTVLPLRPSWLHYHYPKKLSGSPSS